MTAEVAHSSSPRRSSSPVLVLGGGLAGIATAIRLAGQGVPVTLIETRKRLGGRATSFVDPTTKEILDNCQHVLLGCCTNLIDLYHRLGVADRIAWHTRLYFMAPDRDGRPVIDVLEADDLPAPLHMTRALLGFKTLTWGEKLAISRGMLAMMRLGRQEREKLNDQSFTRWLADHRQPAGAIEKFWAVVVIGAINEWPERMGAGFAIQVFQEAFLAHERAYVMGLSSVPLVQLYDAAERVITAAGGKVLLGRSVERVLGNGRRVEGIELDGNERLAADQVVSALPFDRLAKVCAPAMVEADGRLGSLGRFDVSPIIGVHLWFDCPQHRPVMDLPHLILMRSPLQWIFNKGLEEESQGPESPGSAAKTPTSQHLHGVISAAHDWVDEPAERIIAMAVAETRKALPAAAKAKVLHARVVKEKRATFSAAPGIDRFRPPARGAIGNLYLAGDWCQTGWPATMEGAVRSGYLAAAALLADSGRPVEPLIADLPAAPFYRLLSREEISDESSRTGPAA